MIHGLAAEGGDARNLARLASRLARANAAIEVLADGAARYLALKSGATVPPFPSSVRSRNVTFDAAAFAVLPEEIRLRLLLRAIDRLGHEGPAELGKVEALLAVLDGALQKPVVKHRPRMKQSLAGALVSLTGAQIIVEPAPPRRRAAN